MLLSRNTILTAFLLVSTVTVAAGEDVVVECDPVPVSGTYSGEECTYGQSCTAGNVQFRCVVLGDAPSPGEAGTFDNGRSTLPSKDNEGTDMADVDVGATADAVESQSTSGGTSAARVASYLLVAAAVGCATTIVGL